LRFSSEYLNLSGGNFSPDKLEIKVVDKSMNFLKNILC